MKAKNEAKYSLAYFGFFPFSGAPKSIWGVKNDYFDRLWEIGAKSQKQLQIK